MDWDKVQGNQFPYYTNGVACTEVEIDCLTGEHTVGVHFTHGIGRVDHLLPGEGGVAEGGDYCFC